MMKKYILSLALIWQFSLATVAQSSMVGSWRGGLQTPMGKLQPSQIDAFVKQTVGQVTTPWFRQFIKTDPTATWQAVQCPIIGIYGSLDMQVFPSNASRLEELIPSARVRVFEGLNHLMQRARTGSPMEYGQIKSSMDPVIIAWLIECLQQIRLR